MPHSAGPARGRAARRVLVALAAAPLVLVVWQADDVVLRTVLTLSLVGAAALAVRRRRRPATPDEVYADALGRASAMRVHLLRTRVAAVHDGRCPALVTVTWRAARTTLLDADGRPLAELERNGLTTAYTLSIPVWDSALVDLLARDEGLGTVSVYGTTDLLAHPGGSVRENGFSMDQYDLAFPSWTGSLPAHPELADW